MLPLRRGAPVGAATATASCAMLLADRLLEFLAISKAYSRFEILSGLGPLGLRIYPASKASQLLVLLVFSRLLSFSPETRERPGPVRVRCLAPTMAVVLDNGRRGDSPRARLRCVPRPTRPPRACVYHKTTTET